MGFYVDTVKREDALLVQANVDVVLGYPRGKPFSSGIGNEPAGAGAICLKRSDGFFSRERKLQVEEFIETHLLHDGDERIVGDQAEVRTDVRGGVNSG